MPKFMLILHTPPNVIPNMSPEEIQTKLQEFQTWLDQMRSSGRYVVSEKLADEGGKVVTLEGGRTTVTDGPFSEAKEVVGGYFTIRAESYEEAVELTRTSPFLALGRIAVRQTDPMGCGGE